MEQVKKEISLEMINFDLLMQEEIKKVRQGNKKSKLLLHACCAPCSSAVLKRLQKEFDITIFFHNPNIYPVDEYKKRKEELIRLVQILNEETAQKEKLDLFEDSVFHQTLISLEIPEFNEQEFYEKIKGYENSAEGGTRCYECYFLRLEKTANFAKINGFDYFCTTLTVSPYKNAFWVNKIGRILEEKYKVCFLPNDFKKRNGYKESIEYSKKYELYRQNYCGCEYSLKDKETLKQQNNQ